MLRSPRLYVGLLLFAIIGILLVGPALAQEPTIVPEPTAAQSQQLSSIVSQFLTNREKLGCGSESCKILVTDFVLQDGRTSPFGIQSAEMLSAAFPKADKSIVVVDRARVQEFLQQERIPARFVNQIGVARWLARKLNADLVVTGELKKGKKSVDLTTFVAEAQNTSQNPVKLIAKFPDDAIDLSPNDTLPPLPPLDEIVNGLAYRAGLQGAGLPRCFHMPNPPYTKEAREAGFEGLIVVEALITLDGKVKPLRIDVGGPGGLNEVTFQTLTTWGCRPALKDGKPVAVVVGFEMNFRLY